MKYRIKSKKIRASTKRTHLKAKRKRAAVPSVLFPAPSYQAESINLDALFEFAALDAPTSKKRRIFRPTFKKGFLATRALMSRLVGVLRARAKDGEDGSEHIPFYAGVLCSSVTVAVLSAAVVLTSLFSAYLAPYERLTVPDTVGMDISDVEQQLQGQFELLISYESCDAVPAGTVISQLPSAGAERKAYKNRPACKITLTVSAGRSFYTVEDFCGADSRNTLLSLRNMGVAVREVRDFSDSSPVGTVVSTYPKAGERLYEGEMLTVTVSLGKASVAVSVPNLYGLNEAQASAILSLRGLSLGSISYARSSADAGKIISQDPSAFSSAEQGSTVNVTVSIGNMTQRFVPDLYSLDLEQASELLAKAGLVLGSVYHVSSAAPSGTVIMQTPAPGTAITSSINKVDVYISS